VVHIKQDFKKLQSKELFVSVFT